MSKKTIIVLSIVIAACLLFAAFQVYTVYKGKQAPLQGESETVSNKEYGITFAYPKGDAGFSLVEPNGQDKGIKKAYLLMPTDEYDDYKNSTDAREAPANISIFVFDLDTSSEVSTTSGSRITQLQNWATDNSSFTSIQLAKNTPDIVEIDGVKALHYLADGLYQQDIYLVAYRGHVYMIVGQYNQTTDRTYTAFKGIIDSISFD